MPIILMYSGPNGSGKSTVKGEVPTVGTYVNADIIQRYLNCTPLEAAQNAEKVREYCLANRLDFTMETVLSTPRNINLLIRAKEAGYYIVCIFVLTNDPDINVRRIAARVMRGGHDVPENKVRSRYERSLNNLILLPELCDELYVFDNSSSREAGEPAMIVQAFHGNVELHPSPNWDREALEALMDGSFVRKYIRQSE